MKHIKMGDITYIVKGNYKKKVLAILNTWNDEIKIDILDKNKETEIWKYIIVNGL